MITFFIQNAKIINLSQGLLRKFAALEQIRDKSIDTNL